MTKKLLIGIVLLISAWTVWSLTGRGTDDIESTLETIIFRDVSQKVVSGRQVLLIQPYMEQIDYANEKRFYDALDRYFAHAQSKRILTTNTVVVLPEYLSTWLVVANEKRSAIMAPTLEGAMSKLVMSSPLDFGRYYLGASEQDKAAASIFRMNAAKMAQIYQSVFTQLASLYQVDIAAGSIILPDPTIVDGKIHINPLGPLYNSTFTFLSHGAVHSSITKKVYPTEEELTFITPGDIDDLNLINIGAGKIANIVCADSWYPDVYRRYDRLGAEVLLVNAFASGRDIMDAPWKGYNGAHPPSYDQSDIATLSEGEAWQKYALLGKIEDTDILVGMTTYLRGDLWGMGSDGSPVYHVDGDGHTTRPVDDQGVMIRFAY